MVVVAVAGGTGGLGQTIVEAIRAQGKHDVKILSRKRDEAKEAELGVPIIAVDYADVDALTKTLEENNVHTLISTVNMVPATGPTELNLIKAAEASKTTKRMISSDYGMDPLPESEAKKLPSMAPKMAAFEALEATKDLEWTVYRTGFFMDYWGMPKVKSYMKPLTFVIDIPHEMAAIPGDGNAPVTFTHTTDVARLMAASLDLEGWGNGPTYTVGDKVTWNEFVALAEEAKGTKFKVVYDDIEKLKRGETTELPGQVPMYAFLPKKDIQVLASAFGLWFAQGLINLDEATAINRRLPQVKTLKVKEMLEKAWKN